MKEVKTSMVVSYFVMSDNDDKNILSNIQEMTVKKIHFYKSHHQLEVS